MENNKLKKGTSTIKFLSSRFKQEKYKMERIFQFLDYLKEKELSPVFYNIESAGTEPEVIIDGKRYLMFSSNNYLGLSTNSRVIEEAKRALKKHGIGPGGSRFLCGNIDVLRKLDREIAELVETEDAITFPTGYMANLAIFKALMDPVVGNSPYKKGSGVIFSDEFNHGTIIDGRRLSHARKVVFQHNNFQDLKNKISKIPKRNHKMIVTEGVFSPEGEISPLSEIVKIANDYNAVLMVDDAHGVGVLGEKGGGTVQHLGLQGQVDIIMGSFDKALGGTGGFLAGNKKLIEYLRKIARPYLLSSAIPAVMAGGLIEAIKICKSSSDLREKLFDNANYLRKNLQKLGFQILGDKKVPVIPVLIGDEVDAMKFSDKLFQENIYAPCFRWPVVPKKTSRIRVTPMSTHDRHHLDALIEAFEKTGKKLKLIS